MEISNKEKSYLMKATLVLAIVVSLYFVVKIIAEIKSYNFIGGGAPASNTITFNGKGEVSASPDLATINFTIRENAKEVKDAQSKVTTKETAVLAFLDKNGIDKKDIKTESYNSSPKYEWRQGICSTPAETTFGSTSYCPPGKSVLVGYEVSEYISVKIRDLDKTGEIVKGIGAVGISEINGPNFSIEKEEKLKAQARKMAINEAREKAEVLAKDLGVRLVRIVNFQENDNYSMPMYGKTLGMADSISRETTPAPTLPTGENKITSNVTITYEIR